MSDKIKNASAEDIANCFWVAFVTCCAKGFNTVSAWGEASFKIDKFFDIDGMQPIIEKIYAKHGEWFEVEFYLDGFKTAEVRWSTNDKYPEVI